MNSVGGGIFTSFLLHVFQIVLALLAGLVVSRSGDTSGYVFLGVLAPILYIGVSQLVYHVPAFVIARRQGRTAFAQGIAIGAGITFLLNAACWGAITGGSFLA